MKRVLASTNKYDRYISVNHGPRKFGVHIDDFSDPKFNNWGMPRFQMSEIHPYDDAEYAWCKRSEKLSNQVEFYRSGKFLDVMYIWAYEPDDYESYDAYVDDVLDDVAVTLRDLNKDVKPVMVHY